ncbi:MAG TPA: AAA family ATPase [Solirubrobacteraceae bacterium]|nr:AAA family ATPase [Solirubrobacteraceae bacterium]
MSLWAELIRELLPGLSAPPADSAWPEDLAVLTGELPAHFVRGGAASTAVAPDLQRTRLFEAMVALLAWAAREQPVLLVLEDVHAADRPSLELAGYVARRVAGSRIMMLLTRRDLPPSADADRLEEALRSRGLLACELPLAPLGPEPVAALALRAARLSDADVQRVVDRAEGNALLAVETARALGKGLGDEVAPSLRGSVRATLAPLPGDVRKLIEFVAVAARALEPVELGALGVLDPVRPSDFPETLVPRLALVQGLLARARGDEAAAELRFQESIAGWERLLHRTRRAESMTTVLADLGRPVVGLVEPERELARTKAELLALTKGSLRAVVP